MKDLYPVILRPPLSVGADHEIAEFAPEIAVVGAVIYEGTTAE
jgi:hypothetical protein